MFPSYVLNNLYVKGSLKNSPTGFQFTIRNNIDSGTVTGLAPITIDSGSINPDKISIKFKDKQIRADQITNDAPLYVYVMSEIQFLVDAEPLQPGTHQLGLLVHTREAGRLQFDITDSVST